MKFIKYFFGNPPAATDDGHDPRKILDSALTDSLISDIISAGPGNYVLCSRNDKISLIVRKLEHIGVLKNAENHRVNIACPIFLACDLPYLKQITAEHAMMIAERLIEQKQVFADAVSGLDAGFSPEVHLYHLLCGAVFDGRFFDRLGRKGAVTICRKQRNGYDYLPVLYEYDTALTEFSASLLCSYNRLDTSSGTFVSFGDADGCRKDMFRWYQRRRYGDADFSLELEQLVTEYGLEELRELLGRKFSDIYMGISTDEEWIHAFEWAGYMHGGHINVPVYEAETLEKCVDKLDVIAAECVLEPVMEALENLASSPKLTAARFDVPLPDIANEVYHLLFGQVNEALIRVGFAAKPTETNGQGRFMRCFEIKATG